MVKRFRFLYQSNGFYVWESTTHTDSRVEQIRCKVDWFWKP